MCIISGNSALCLSPRLASFSCGEEQEAKSLSDFGFAYTRLTSLPICYIQKNPVGALE
jgi:hypothetical protein